MEGDAKWTRVRYAFMAIGILAGLCLVSCSGGPSPASGKDNGRNPGLALSAWTGDLVVRTVFGAVRGHPDRLGTLSWKGLPYAAPPLGELRWRAPRDPLPWKGLRDAASFGKSAVQLAPFVGGAMGSEDCLYLNVWRPAGKETKLPVYVYIHGGGNTTGSAGMINDYLGWGVAAKSKFVFVSMNYRLGPLGWFLDPAVAEGGESDGGNFGTLDIIKALSWIHDNIEAFGGDPSRVTIAGESAGAFNVLSLLLAPSAQGLFQAAISESGAQNSVSRTEAQSASADLIDSWLVKTGRARTKAEARNVALAMPKGELAALMRGAKAKDLVGLRKGGVTGMTGWPSIIRDGLVLPTEGFDVLRSGDWPNKVPLIIGSNKEELKLFLYFDRKLSWKGPLYQEAARYGSLSWKASGVDDVADAIASREGGPPVYVYRFDWGAPDDSGSSPMPGNWGRRLGAFHSLEVSFFLGTGTCLGPLFTGTLFTGANRKGREALSADIMAYLAAFAATGNPNAVGGNAAGVTDAPTLPEWPRRPTGLAFAPGAGQAVGIVFDATREAVRITPLTEVVTRKGVVEAIDADLPAELAAAVRARLLIR